MINAKVVDDILNPKVKFHQFRFLFTVESMNLSKLIS